MTSLNNNDNSVNSDDETKKPGDTTCICKNTFATACATLLWLLCLATNNCWTTCNDNVTRASIFGFGIFVLFMLGVEKLFQPKQETVCEALEALDKEFGKIKTAFGKFGCLSFNFTVFVTLVAELSAILDPERSMWYREQALYMYAFLMYSNTVGAKLWSVVHTLIFSLFSDCLALRQSIEVVMNPRSLGLILGYCGIAYEVVQSRNDTAVLKDHFPFKSIPFFPLLYIPGLSALNSIVETSVMNYLVIGTCLLYCSSEMPTGEKRSDASRMERFGAHLFHASIWTQIAVVLLQSLDGTTGTRALWTLGFLLYAHLGSFEVINVCFVWGITILGAVNNIGYNQGNLPLTTTVAVVRTVVMMLAVVDQYLNPKKEKDEEDACKSKGQADTGTKVLLDAECATEYVPLVDAA